METNSERQELEVEAMRAIYEGDFEDLRQSDPWKVPRPPEVAIRLRPNHDSRGERHEHCSVRLRAKVGEEYPARPPALLALEEPRGLSDEEVSELTALLKSRAEEMRGEEVLAELAVMAGHWLSAHNRPPGGSFHEMMQHRERERKEKEDRERAAKEEANQKLR